MKIVRSHVINIKKAGFTLIEGIIAISIISTGLIVGLTLAYSNLITAQANSERIIANQLAREGLEVVRNVRDSNWLRREANLDADNDQATPVQLYRWFDFTDGWPIYPVNYGNFFDIILKDPYDSSLNNGIESLYTLHAVPPYTLGNGQVVPSNALACIVVMDAAGTPDQYCIVQKEKLADGSVRYFQASAPKVGATPTPFRRRIIIKPICYTAASGDIVKEIVPNYNLLIPDPASEYCDVAQTEKFVGVLVTSQVLWKKGQRLSQVELKEKLYNWRSQ